VKSEINKNIKSDELESRNGNIICVSENREMMEAVLRQF